MKILVTGGAGYIGSHTALQLLSAGHQVLIADDFSHSRRSVLSRLGELAGAAVPSRELDVTNEESVVELLNEQGFDAVFHFAGFKAVGESVDEPLRYYANNVSSTTSLLRAMRRTGVHHFVFSSSATVYGVTTQPPLREDHPIFAINPYGWTKVMQEQILTDAARAWPEMRVGILRYFNPVGAHDSGRIGEDPAGRPNNLMPLMARVAMGKTPQQDIYGDDYPTPDGTARRDYVHVEDLASGHAAALEYLRPTASRLSVWNLGTGKPSSVLEMVNAFSRAIGRQLPTRVVARRPGDVADSFADTSKARAELGWVATRSVEDMCRDAWRWQSQNPRGYPSESLR